MAAVKEKVEAAVRGGEDVGGAHGLAVSSSTTMLYFKSKYQVSRIK